MKQKKAKILKPERAIPHYVALILVCAVVFIAHHNSLRGEFVYDDKGLVIDNALIKDAARIKDIFTTQLFEASGTYSNAYRPLQSLSLMLDYHLWKLNPFGYHLTNILIHILNSIGVYFLIYLVSKKRDISLITALLFSAHAVLSGVVNYVSARADLLYVFFLLITAVLYVLYKGVYFGRYRFLLYLGSFLAFLLALLTKEASYIFPLVLLFYLYCFSESKVKSQKSAPSLIWIFFILVAAYTYLRITALDFTEGRLLETTVGATPLYYRLLTTSKVIMIYIRLLLVPIGLHMEWIIRPAVSFFQDEIFLSVVGLFVIGVFSYFLYRTSRLKFFAIGWFFITLIPYSNIYPLAYFMGDGWLYLSSIGFFALLAMYLSDLRRRSKTWSLVVVCIVVSTTISYAFLSIKRADVWGNPSKFYNEILKYSPDNTKARIGLGIVLADPDLGTSADHLEQGTTYANNQMHDKALEEFKKAIEVNPGDYIAYNNIGIIYKMKGDFEKAEEKYKKALGINPNYHLAYNNLGNIYLETARYDEAIECYKKAIEIAPYTSACYENIGKAYRNKGMIKEAREVFEKALQLDPNNSEAMEGLESLD
ncbi:tetratricopeptide repeat protein [Candidatus Omnitrophota bacterium]